MAVSDSVWTVCIAWQREGEDVCKEFMWRRQLIRRIERMDGAEIG